MSLPPLSQTGGQGDPDARPTQPQCKGCPFFAPWRMRANFYASWYEDRGDCNASPGGSGSPDRTRHEWDSCPAHPLWPAYMEKFKAWSTRTQPPPRQPCDAWLRSMFRRQREWRYKDLVHNASFVGFGPQEMDDASAKLPIASMVLADGSFLCRWTSNEAP